MAQASGVSDEEQLLNWIKALGPLEVLRVVSPEVGLPESVRQFGIKQVIDALRRQPVIDAAGVKQVINAVGLKQVIDAVGLDELLASLTPEQRAEFKQRLQ